MSHTRVMDAAGISILTQGEGLRPVLRYARHSPVFRVRLDHSVGVGTVGQYAVTFYFDDGARATTLWADWRVLLDWLLARRSWAVDRVFVAEPFLLDKVDAHRAATKLRARGTNVVGSPHLIA